MVPLLIAVSLLALILVLGRRGSGSHDPRMSGLVRSLSPPSGLPVPILLARVEGGLRRAGLRLGLWQVVLPVTAGSVLLAVVAFRLLHNPLAAMVIGGLGMMAAYLRIRQLEQKRRETLALQFKEALTSIAYSLRAGASLPMAMERALLDLKRIFPAGSAEPIVAEFEELVQQLRLGVPTETVLTDWERRVRLEEISDFTAATLAVKTRGGNLAEVMATVGEAISWKIVAQAQIRAMTAEKRSEANLLTAAPTVILVLLWLVAPHYIAPLFTTGGGQTLLLVGLICNVLAFLAVRKILETPL